MEQRGQGRQGNQSFVRINTGTERARKSNSLLWGWGGRERNTGTESARKIGESVFCGEKYWNREGKEEREIGLLWGGGEREREILEQRGQGREISLLWGGEILELRGQKRQRNQPFVGQNTGRQRLRKTETGAHGKLKQRRDTLNNMIGTDEHYNINDREGRRVNVASVCCGPAT